MICIVCPKGCHLDVVQNADGGDIITVSGAGCPKGVEYARAELLNPTRVLTTTIEVTGGSQARVSVKTTAPIPKPMLMEAMTVINSLSLPYPVPRGMVVVEDLLGIGVSVVVTGHAV